MHNGIQEGMSLLIHTRTVSCNFWFLLSVICVQVYFAQDSLTLYSIQTFPMVMVTKARRECHKRKNMTNARINWMTCHSTCLTTQSSR